MSSTHEVACDLRILPASENEITCLQMNRMQHNMLDAVEDICFIASPDGRMFYYLNEHASKHLGYEASSLASLSVKAVVAPLSLDRICDAVQHDKALQPVDGSIKCAPLHVELLKKDGMHLPGRLHLFLQMSSDNDVIAISGVVNLKDTTPDQDTANSEDSDSMSAAKDLQGRVMIMDDEDILVDIAVQMGGRLGLLVDSATNGADALSMYKTAMEQGHPYDVVLLDMTITGGMGGVEASNELHLLDPDVKTVVMSGYSDHEAVLQPQKFGFSDVIVKPFRLSEFTRVLHDLIPEEKFRANSKKESIR